MPMDMKVRLTMSDPAASLQASEMGLGIAVTSMPHAVPLIERLRAQDFAVLVTSGTVTSAALAEQRLPDDLRLAPELLAEPALDLHRALMRERRQDAVKSRRRSQAPGAERAGRERHAGVHRLMDSQVALRSIDAGEMRIQIIRADAGDSATGAARLQSPAVAARLVELHVVSAFLP